MADGKVRRRPARPSGSGTGAARRRTPRMPRLTRARPRGVVAATTGLLGLSSTRRAAILAIVVCAVALTVVVPLRNFVAGRQELAAVQARQDALAADVARLTQEQQRLRDPAEIESQARSRLGYAMPGEVPYVVQLPHAALDPAAAAAAGTPWYTTLWHELAGAPA
jgi:cell division protein FtsB